MTLWIAILLWIIVVELAALIWGSYNWFNDSIRHYRDVNNGLARVMELLTPPVNYDGSVGLVQEITVGESPIGQEEKENEEDIGVKIPDTLTYKA